MDAVLIADFISRGPDTQPAQHVRSEAAKRRSSARDGSEGGTFVAAMERSALGTQLS